MRLALLPALNKGKCMTREKPPCFLLVSLWRDATENESGTLDRATRPAPMNAVTCSRRRWRNANKTLFDAPVLLPAKTKAWQSHASNGSLAAGQYAYGKKQEIKQNWGSVWRVWSVEKLGFREIKEIPSCTSACPSHEAHSHASKIKEEVGFPTNPGNYWSNYVTGKYIFTIL